MSGPDATTKATMPLLDLVTRQSMDEDYTLVAARRKAAGAPARPPERGRAAAVTVAVLAASALLATVAGVQTSRNADVTALGRASLVERIQLAKDSARTLQEDAGKARAANAELEERSRELVEQEARLASQVRQLGTRTGSLAVVGPGIRIVVDDAPDGDPDQVVRDSDLALLVDGLWSAGAEAIAINGQRLSVLSPLQNSGQAIHVNVRPLSPPYSVEAIGNPRTLEARWAASTGGATFRGVADALGFPTRVEDVDELSLPATRVRTLRSAEKLTDDKLKTRRERDEEDDE